MTLEINWGEPVIKETDILSIQPSDLDDFYVTADAYDRSNIFFVLLSSYHYYLDKKKQNEAAHLSFLMAYYLFITLTPPGSYNLSLHYINEAVSLNPLPEYKEWLLLIQKGN